MLQSGAVRLSCLPSRLLLMHLPLCFGDPHEHFLVFDWYPARQHLHGVLKIGLEEYVTHAINQGSGCSMQNIEGRSKLDRFFFALEWRCWIIPEQHEDVPYPQLCWEGNRVVEQSKIPLRTVGSRHDIHVTL